jgi:Ras-related protein Rab-2A
MSYNYSFKYIVAGNPGVGKSSLLLKFMEEKFKVFYDITIGVDLGYRIISLNDTKIKICIYDTAGQERFQSITRQYFANTAVAFILYDICDSQSYEAAKHWLGLVKTENVSNITIVLIGNKTDKEAKRQVSTEDAKSFAMQQDIYFYELSVRNNSVKDIFYTTAQLTLQKVNSNNFSSGVKLGYEKDTMTINDDFVNNNKLVCCNMM